MAAGVERSPVLRGRSQWKQQYDRFIPFRSSMDMDYAKTMIYEASRKGLNQSPEGNDSDYKKQLAQCLGLDRTRLLSFKSKPPERHQRFPHDKDFASLSQNKVAKPRRYISQTPERTLDAPDLIDDYYLNLLDWGSSNVLCIALSDTVYLWNNGSISELVTIDEELGPVTSVSWAPDGCSLAVGLNSSDVQLWDTIVNRKLATLSGGHQSRVGSLAWNEQILTTGGMDALVINNDIRAPSHIVQTYQGHNQEVCGLKWSSSGKQLASGGNDNLLHIWDRSMASSTRTPWLHRLREHRGAVRALSWCSFQHNMLASGGGGLDQCIKFWNTHTGACLNSVDTGSQVCALLWSNKEHELLSSHGLTRNQITLWKYPSMEKLAELSGHTSRVLFVTQSPNGCTVATASAQHDEECIKFWNVFGTPAASRPAPRTNLEPFAHLNLIR